MGNIEVSAEDPKGIGVVLADVSYIIYTSVGICEGRNVTHAAFLPQLETR